MKQQQEVEKVEIPTKIAPNDITYIRDKKGRPYKLRPGNEVVQYVGRTVKDFHNCHARSIKSTKDGNVHEIVFDRVYRGYKNCAWIPDPELRAELLIMKTPAKASQTGYVLVNNPNYRVMVENEAEWRKEFDMLKTVWKIKYREKVEEDKLADLIMRAQEDL